MRMVISSRPMKLVDPILFDEQDQVFLRRWLDEIGQARQIDAAERVLRMQRFLTWLGIAVGLGVFWFLAVLALSGSLRGAAVIGIAALGVGMMAGGLCNVADGGGNHSRISNSSTPESRHE